MSDRTPAEVLAAAIDEHADPSVLADYDWERCRNATAAEWVEYRLAANNLHIVPADQRTVADPDGLLPEGELRVFEAWPDVLPRWDVTLIVATPEPSP